MPQKTWIPEYSNGENILIISSAGAPEVRAMKMIEESEPTVRGVSCGSIGYIDFSSWVDLNIAIRKEIHRDGRLFFPVGGGIVADSDPDEKTRRC